MVLWGIILGLVQFLLALFIKDIFKSFMVVSLVVFVLSFGGKYNCYNPMMLSKHSLMNTIIGIHPLNTIISQVITILLVSSLIPKVIKIAIKRGCI